MARMSLRTVRYGLVATALLLVTVVAGFVGYARYRLHRALEGLPGRLGVHITQESDNVTYSQSVKGRTVYTVHAAKQIEREAGKYTLRDVGIVMYGMKGDRADRIHGNEFEWDQKQGVMTAVGEVFIDLGAPAAATAKKNVDDESRLIHVKTSGLVFRQKERSATTDEGVEFSTGEMSGTSVGASYDSGTGSVVLRSAVRMSGLRGGKDGDKATGRPMVLTATRAEMNRAAPTDAEAKGAAALGVQATGAGSLVKLDGAKLVSATEDGEQSGSAVRSVVHLAEDGTPREIEAKGQVTLTGDGREGGRRTVTSDRMQGELNAAGQMQAVHFWGDVRMAEDGPARGAAGGANRASTREGRGKAADARVSFDAVGRPVHAVMTGGVEVNEKAGTSQRRLEAAKLELALAGGGKEPVAVRGAVASGEGGARLRLLDASGGKDKGGMTDTAVRAEVLTGRFAAAAAGASVARGGMQLAGMDGVGKTSVEQVATDAKGAVESKETSTGDRLKMDFRAVPQRQSADARSELVRAEQKGAVSVVRESRGKSVTSAGQGSPASSSAKMEVEHATGELAVYEKEADRLTMTGGVQISDAQSALFADQVVTNRASGETTAQGGVRVSYLGEGGTGEPIHVLAARAVSHKATGITNFFAASGGKAKMWQGGSQVEAQLLDFDQTKKTVVARDERGSDEAVRAVLVDAAKADSVKDDPVKARAKAAKGAAGPAKGETGPIRVTSRDMTYKDAAREVDFRGKVKVEDQDGTMRSEQATVYLMPAAGRAAKTAPVTLGGRVDHMVGVGGVEIEQPGRKATGERLVYTAADQTFVLTGTKAAPPKMVDETHGTTTGAALRFRSGDDTVTVSGTDAGSETRRVRSETKVKQ